MHTQIILVLNIYKINLEMYLKELAFLSEHMCMLCIFHFYTECSSIKSTEVIRLF